jgi:hypothetical protein
MALTSSFPAAGSDPASALTDAYGCPLLDCCSASRPFAGARVPFFAALLLDDVDSLSDEYAAPNSVCYGDPFEDCPHGGVAFNSNLNLNVIMSDNRIPVDISTPGRCFSITGSSASKVTTRNDAVERTAQATAAGVTQHFCPESLHHLRKRQLQAERYGNISAAHDPVYETIASSTVQAVVSDRLEPLQLEQLRAVVARYKD